jgi:lipopolysaccharide export system protein LptC
LKFTITQIYQFTLRGLLRILPLLLIGSLTLATFWLVKRSSPPEALPLARVPQHVPDYILKNASLSNLNELGQTKYRILGKKLTHYEDDASMDLEFPRMRAFQTQGSAPVTLKADRGHIDGDLTILDLFGNGEIFRPAQEAIGDLKASPRLLARSSFFQALINDDIVRTDKPLELQQGMSIMNSTGGGIFNNVQQSVMLTGQVRGRIEPSEQRGRN